MRMDVWKQGEVRGGRRRARLGIAAGCDCCILLLLLLFSEGMLEALDRAEESHVIEERHMRVVSLRSKIIANQWAGVTRLDIERVVVREGRRWIGEDGGREDVTSTRSMWTKAWEGWVIGRHCIQGGKVDARLGVLGQVVANVAGDEVLVRVHEAGSRVRMGRLLITRVALLLLTKL